MSNLTLFEIIAATIDGADGDGLILTGENQPGDLAKAILAAIEANQQAAPTYGALVEALDEVLRDQEDCAMYLEPDTQAVSREIYNRNLKLLRAAQGHPLGPHDLWLDGDEPAAEAESSAEDNLPDVQIAVDADGYEYWRERDNLPWPGLLWTHHSDGWAAFVDGPDDDDPVYETGVHTAPTERDRIEARRAYRANRRQNQAELAQALEEVVDFSTG